MRSTLRRLLPLLTMPWLMLAACPTEEPSSVCGDVSRALTYVAGLEASGAEGRLEASLLVAAPAPPDVGDNEWTLEIREPGGEALIGCAAVIVAEMPDHGHGSSTAPAWTEIEAGDDDDDDSAVGAGTGVYSLSRLDFFMPGYWVVSLSLQCGAVTDVVAYGFCAEG